MSFSCARRVDDPTNPSATCSAWCGNSLTCLTTEHVAIMQLVAQYGNASQRGDHDAASSLHKMIASEAWRLESAGGITRAAIAAAANPRESSADKEQM